jgi:hypothetical protein
LFATAQSMASSKLHKALKNRVFQFCCAAAEPPAP